MTYNKNMFREIEERARQEAHEKIERIKKEIQEKLAKEDIICPYCRYIQDNEARGRYVTYWGDDGERECLCENCSKKFIVDEKVEREFTCTKIE